MEGSRGPVSGSVSFRTETGLLPPLHKIQTVKSKVFWKMAGAKKDGVSQHRSIQRSRDRWARHIARMLGEDVYKEFGGKALEKLPF